MDFKNSYIISYSPIEFVLIGPLSGHDKLLVSSDTAQLDLKGLAIGRDISDASLRPTNRMLAMLGANSRRLNVIDSHPTEDLLPLNDSRTSSYRFAWVGEVSEFSKSEIELVFNRALPDLRHAIGEGDPTDVELMVSPLILSCANENRLTLESRRKRLFFLASYALFIGAIIASLTVAEFTK